MRLESNGGELKSCGGEAAIRRRSAKSANLEEGGDRVAAEPAAGVVERPDLAWGESGAVRRAGGWAVAAMRLSDSKKARWVGKGSETAVGMRLAILHLL